MRLENRPALSSIVTFLLIVGWVWAQALGVAATPAAAPLRMDTTYVPPSGRTLAVAAGGDFQEALDSAEPGDVITLEAGAMYRGPFTLPRKQGSGWIVVRPSKSDARLPPPGTRIDPSHAGVMPKLVAATDAVIQAAPGAHHFRFTGIEIRPTPGVFLYALVDLGAGERREALSHHIIIDRCYLHGDPKQGTRRGIALNATHVAVIDSYLSDFKEVGADSQAIAGWAGPGPFKITNNYLEAAGENVMFGGSDPPIANLVPSDIEIRNNHFSKPLSWKVGHPSYAGTPWTVKNLFELKNARRVLIDGNLFEHSWAQAQTGFAILFTVRNQDGAAPWSVVEDVTFTHNIVRHATSGISVLGCDDNHPSQQVRRILIRDNLFEDVGGAQASGGSRLFQLVRGAADVVIDHNSAFQSDVIIMAEGEPHANFVFTNNIMPHLALGIVGTGTATGMPTLERYFPGAIVKGNVLAGGNAARYPAGNFFPVSLDDVGFVNRVTGDRRLALASRYKSAGAHGRDPGADVDALPRDAEGRTQSAGE